MKSSISELKSRGWIDEKIIYDIHSFDDEMIDKLLVSSIPAERTLAAKIIFLKQMTGKIAKLCEQLQKEKKLYTKLQICETLAGFGPPSVKYLISLLGKIGKNQHKEITKKAFSKNSYPLPRDIAARILIRIGKPAIPALVEVIKGKDRSAILEAIDAIGFISFQTGSQDAFIPLLYLFHDISATDELMLWKLVRAFEAFPQSKPLLEKIAVSSKNKFIQEEAMRSLRQVKSNPPAAE